MENYENNLFKTANKLRGKIPPSDYKFYVLPLVFIRYMSEKNKSNVWEKIVDESGQEGIATLLDQELKKILPGFDQVKNPYENIYSESNLPVRTIKELVDLIHEIDINGQGKKVDYLGRIYEYFKVILRQRKGTGEESFLHPLLLWNFLYRC